MRTRTWSRIRTEAVWTLVVLLGIPALAQAQQTGLFPLRPIKRERVPCAAEDPVYRQHREMYYGYYPTCWRKFPPGWGCMSPEAPNAAASFEKLKRKEPTDQDFDGGRGGAMDNEDDLGPRRGAEPPPNQGQLPAVPPAENLFDINSPKQGDTPPAIPPPNAPRNRSTPGAGANAPAAPEVGLAPREAAPAAGPADTFQPLPVAPPADAPPASSGNPLPAVEAPASASNEPDAAPSAQPERAPQRRGLLGSLFGGLRRR